MAVTSLAAASAFAGISRPVVATQAVTTTTGNHLL
jgi:hypothetical protein